MRPAILWALLITTGCVTLPPGGATHAKFVRSAESEPLPRAGFAAHAHVLGEQRAAPLVDGWYAERLSRSYDGSFAVRDGLAMYEGLVRFGSDAPVGLVHGLGLGVPLATAESSVALALNVGADLGVFGQIGPGFYGTLTYSPLIALFTDSSPAVVLHFAAAEIGYVVGHNLQFAPNIKFHTPVGSTGLFETGPSPNVLLGVAVQASF